MDWERLEAEFADTAGIADAAARERDGGLVDRIVATARRRQLRRSALIVGMAGLLVAASVGVALSVVVVPDRRGVTHPLVRAARAPRLPDTGAQAQIYAAALRAGLHSARPVWVRTSACVAGPSVSVMLGSEPCAGGVITASVRSQVRAALGGQVRFAAHPPVPQRAGDPPVVRFGPLVLAGAQARLGIDMRCGQRCTEGETLVLRRRDGHWHVVGSAGPRWVS